MGPLVYIVAIMGCAADGALCQPVMREPVRFESMTACMAAAQASLERHTDLSYPVISARCETRGVQTASR